MLVSPVALSLCRAALRAASWNPHLQLSAAFGWSTLRSEITINGVVSSHGDYLDCKTVGPYLTDEPGSKLLIQGAYGDYIIGPPLQDYKA